MGRSVSYLNHATTVCYEDVSWMGREQQCPNDDCESYFELEEDTCPDCGAKANEEEMYSESTASFQWEYWEEYLIERFTKKYPSLYGPNNKWDNRETKVILENNLIEIGISEYCGLASISVQPKEDESSLYNLAKRNARYVGIWMEKNIGDLVSVGRFSNGEQVLERKEK